MLSQGSSNNNLNNLNNDFSGNINMNTLKNISGNNNNYGFGDLFGNEMDNKMQSSNYEINDKIQFILN